MNITRENVDELNAVLKIEINADDYETKVKNVLKDHQKKANLPGFRPGKVPFGMIKRMYGNSVTMEEVNKLLSESITNYITENNVKILGNPLPNEEKSPRFDIENDTDFEFYFDIGMAPEVDLEISDKIKVNYYTIKTDEKLIQKYLDDIQKRNGEHIHPDTVEDGDILKGNIVELDEDGKAKAEGVQNETSISVDFIKDKRLKKKMLEMKTGDDIQFNPLKATDNATETATMLGIEKEKAENLETDFEFTLNEITRHQPAELNEDLYKKVYPAEDIKDTEAFKERIEKDAAVSLSIESDRLFLRDASDKLMEEAGLSLPDDFLKRWLMENNDGKVTKEQIEKEYDEYAKSLKWQLIENKIIKDNDLKVDEKDVRDHVKTYLGANMFKGKEGPEQDQQMNQIVDMVLQNKDEKNKITDELMDKKLMEVLKNNLTIKQKEVSYDDFINLATQNKFK